MRDLCSRTSGLEPGSTWTWATYHAYRMTNATSQGRATMSESGAACASATCTDLAWILDRVTYNGNTIAHNGIIMTITIAYIQSIIVQLLSHGTPCKRHAISTMISPLARDFQTHRRRTRASLWNKQCNSVFCLRYRHDTMKGAGVDNRRQTYDGERQQLHGHGNEQARAQSARRKRQEPARGHRTRSSRSEQVVPAMQRETQRRRNNCRPQEDSP
ncbi:hypothetical protein OH76DRAFT_909359 [Lentinus brumalis]|uniref:Uncharacterized protein n=1 Tax=Lentinus brumalis TaxID=2498619 RepID=A0A371D0I4_9APHY|nr:hypothetical protein OH76DRAFT_909359 [Polyporus brumalis]